MLFVLLSFFPNGSICSDDQAVFIGFEICKQRPYNIITGAVVNTATIGFIIQNAFIMELFTIFSKNPECQAPVVKLNIVGTFHCEKWLLGAISKIANH